MIISIIIKYKTVRTDTTTIARSRRRKTNVQENGLEIEKGLAGLT